MLVVLALAVVGGPVAALSSAAGHPSATAARSARTCRISLASPS
ncbi:MAG TPA: hypothetical protein VG164_02815 [Trebonia sp.]|nr:hypothetical protein [Trebonia sp.]